MPGIFIPDFLELDGKPLEGLKVSNVLSIMGLMSSAKLEKRAMIRGKAEVAAWYGESRSEKSSKAQENSEDYKRKSQSEASKEVSTQNTQSTSASQKHRGGLENGSAAVDTRAGRTQQRRKISDNERQTLEEAKKQAEKDATEAKAKPSPRHLGCYQGVGNRLRFNLGALEWEAYKKEYYVEREIPESQWAFINIGTDFSTPRAGDVGIAREDADKLRADYHMWTDGWKVYEEESRSISLEEQYRIILGEFDDEELKGETGDFSNSSHMRAFIEG
ncbi:MAG: hypothetical protein Q9170_007193 [Blastenia crenularia]